MDIHEIKNSDKKAWDEYVLQHPASTFYHQIGWKHVVENSYGHKPYYLLAEENGEVKGVLPIFFMKSLLFGRKLVSVPFAPYGGSVAEDNTIEEILVRYGAEITKQVGGDYMELRNKYSDSKLPVNAKYMTLVLELNEDPEVVWKGFNNKVRNAIRNSLKYNLEINEGSIEDFYKLYSKNMRSLGTPTHSRKFFNTVISEFRGKADIQIVQLMGEPVSAAILLYFKDTVISGWAASAREYREFSPNNLLYWDAIKSACEKGYKYFDFGRSIEGSGTYRFKKPWGAQEKQLQYVYYLNRVKYMPDTSQANLKRRQFAKLWQALPLSLTNALGTKLRRNLP